MNTQSIKETIQIVYLSFQKRSQMTLSKLAQSAKVIHKGQNHKGENCYYAIIGDKVIDAIQNLHTGMMEICKPFKSESGEFQLLRYPLVLNKLS